jgi:hypothetical protein
MLGKRTNKKKRRLRKKKEWNENVRTGGKKA